MKKVGLYLGLENIGGFSRCRGRAIPYPSEVLYIQTERWGSVGCIEGTVSDCLHGLSYFVFLLVCFL